MTNNYQYLDALKRFTPDTASKDFHDFLGELDEAGATQKEGDLDWMESMTKSLDEDRRTKAYSIQRAGDAREKISYRRSSSDSGAVRIWGGRLADACTALEEDFTTPGTPGRLGCPFTASRRPRSANSNKGISTPRSSTSRISLGRRSKRASFHDPIKVDICGNSAMVPEASIEGSVPLCPIRFLDQHSPEEVARYFEKHKHELPRSHENCVKRFQENEGALRSLDSRYANIVSMVNDLGKVHQPMLPDTEDIAVDDGEEHVHNSAVKVENWAKAIHTDEDEDEADSDPPQDVEEDREQRFDRSLKDIRVGESPSRPWGITVPENFKPNGDGASKKSDPTASPLEQDTGQNSNVEIPTGPRCPFSGLHANPQLGAAAMGKEPEEPKPEPQSTTKAQSSEDIPGTFKQFPQHTPSQMVFNGPVFIGYPLEQAMGFMKQFGSTHPGGVM